MTVAAVLVLYRCRLIGCVLGNGTDDVDGISTYASECQRASGSSVDTSSKHARVFHSITPLKFRLCTLRFVNNGRQCCYWCRKC